MVAISIGIFGSSLAKLACLLAIFQHVISPWVILTISLFSVISTGMGIDVIANMALVARSPAHCFAIIKFAGPLHLVTFIADIKAG